MLSSEKLVAFVSTTNADHARAFYRDKLGLKLIFDADRNMRSARPDDRIVMEKFIFELTR